MDILWLKVGLLHPIDKGGKVLTYHVLKELKRDHHITYLALDDGTDGEGARARAAEYCHELLCVPHRMHPKFSPGFYADLVMNLASPLPYSVQKYQSAEVLRQIAQHSGQGHQGVLICDGLSPSVNLPSDVSRATVLFQHNVEAIIWRRHCEVQVNPLKKAYLYDQWRKTRRYEQGACARFDQVVAVSPIDRETIRRDYGIESVLDVPIGVDIDYFRPRAGSRPVPHSLVFTGSMDWLPNEDAVHYFAAQILPLIRQAVPDATLTVVGRNPRPGLRKLGSRDPSIVVTGNVEDVRPYMEQAAAYVVPLRVGGGARLKIYEAMAMEKPIVSTTVGAEGLPVRDGEELLLADTPEAFAEAVVRVITNDDLARDLSVRASATVRAGAGWDKVAASFAEAFESGLRRRESNPAQARAETITMQANR